MEVPSNASREQVADILQKEEAAPLTEEELEFAKIAQEDLTEEQKKHTSTWDLITVVRGYQSFKPRDAETKKALNNIWKFRDDVGYTKFLTGDDIGVPQEVCDLFHKFWPDEVHGVDKYGHPLMMLTLKDINVDEISKIDEELVVRLVAQKLTAFTEWRNRLSKKTGVQRYKYSLCIDLDGSGVGGLVAGKKKALLSRFFSIGGDYFPESIWKIYVINTPFVFRMAWGIMKVWVHPITLAKVNVFSATKHCIPQILEDGWELDQLPALFGGSFTPKSTKACMDEVLAEALTQQVEENLSVAE